jgi:hypothetical protein
MIQTKLLVNTAYNGKKLSIGDIVPVDSITADRWASLGIAEIVPTVPELPEKDGGEEECQSQSEQTAMSPPLTQEPTSADTTEATAPTESVGKPSKKPTKKSS